MKTVDSLNGELHGGKRRNVAKRNVATSSGPDLQLPVNFPFSLLLPLQIPVSPIILLVNPLTRDRRCISKVALEDYSRPLLALVKLAKGVDEHLTFPRIQTFPMTGQFSSPFLNPKSFSLSLGVASFDRVRSC